MSKVRIAVNARVFMDWSGGIDFILYLTNAIAQNPQYKVFFLVPDQPAPDFSVDEKINPLKHSRRSFALRRLRLKRHSISRRTLSPALNDLNPSVKLFRFKNDAAGFLDLLDLIGADIVIPSTASLGEFFPYPWVGYIWDYQHRYLPQYFNENELKNRDKIFNKILEQASSVIVNSQTTRNDIAKFTPRNKRFLLKVIALPFAPYPVKTWFSSNKEAALKRYNLKNRYFIVCNQFWVHKSHKTAIEALAKVIQKNPDVMLVCTGKMEEPRSPDYISEVKVLIKKLNLDKNLLLLGYIPKQDQIALLKGAISLIQPTLYEGGPGGGAAYNAVALGVPVIASDIPVNLEMKEDHVSFFKAGSAADLAAKMEEALSSSKPGMSTDRALKNGNRRLGVLSEELSKAINYALENSRK